MICDSLRQDCCRKARISRAGRTLMRSMQDHGFGSIPSDTGAIARLACAQLCEFGKDAAAVLAEAGATTEQAYNDAVRLEVHKQIRILNLAAEELGDEVLGFHLGRNFNLREIGLVYYVMASSEQLSDALRNAERYSVILNDGFRLHFRQDDRTHDCARLRQRRPALGPAPDRVLAGDPDAHMPANHGQPRGTSPFEGQTPARCCTSGIQDVLRDRYRV